MNWFVDNIKAISILAIVTPIILAIASGFLNKLGEEIYHKFSKLWIKPDVEVDKDFELLEVDKSFEPHDVASNNYVWVGEDKKFSCEQVGYTYYNHPANGSKCFRVITLYGSVRGNEYLMRRP